MVLRNGFRIYETNSLWGRDNGEGKGKQRLRHMGTYSDRRRKKLERGRGSKGLGIGGLILIGGPRNWTGEGVAEAQAYGDLILLSVGCNDGHSKDGCILMG